MSNNNGSRAQFIKDMKMKLVEQRNSLMSKANEMIDIDSDGDETDEVQANFLMGIVKQLGARDLNKIKMIDGALKRIEESTYGFCEDCEEDIPEKRLMANPYFSTCVICAETRERKH